MESRLLIILADRRPRDTPSTICSGALAAQGLLGLRAQGSAPRPRANTRVDRCSSSLLGVGTRAGGVYSGAGRGPAHRAPCYPNGVPSGIWTGVLRPARRPDPACLPGTGINNTGINSFSRALGPPWASWPFLGPHWALYGPSSRPGKAATREGCPLKGRLRPARRPASPSSKFKLSFKTGLWKRASVRGPRFEIPLGCIQSWPGSQLANSP